MESQNRSEVMTVWSFCATGTDLRLRTSASSITTHRSCSQLGRYDSPLCVDDFYRPLALMLLMNWTLGPEGLDWEHLGGDASEYRGVHVSLIRLDLRMK